MGLCRVAQAGLELKIFMPQLPDKLREQILEPLWILLPLLNLLAYAEA